MCDKPPVILNQDQDSEDLSLIKATEQSANITISEEIQVIDEELNQMGKYFNQINNNIQTHQILYLIDAAHHSFGQWSQNDQATIYKIFLPVKKLFILGIKQYKTLCIEDRSELNIKEEILTDLAQKCFLIQMKSLKIIMCKDIWQKLCKFFTILSKVQSLKILSFRLRSLKDRFFEENPIRGNLISNLYPLSDLLQIVNLTVLDLDLSNNIINDLKPLSNIKSLLNLKSLKICLNENKISDLNPLSDLMYLVNLTALELDLSNNEISDFEPLSNIKSLLNLESLKICLNENNISDLNPLSNFQYLLNLTSLEINLEKNQISDLNPLSKFKFSLNLKSLQINLGLNKIIDINPLSNLLSLVDLKSLTIKLWGNQISDLNPLSNLFQQVNLISFELELHWNKISNIDVLKNLRYLVNLNHLQLILYTNKISNLDSLQNLRYLINLKSLVLLLNENKISNINPLSNLKYLVAMTKFHLEVEYRFNFDRRDNDGGTDISSDFGLLEEQLRQSLQKGIRRNRWGEKKNELYLDCE